MTYPRTEGEALIIGPECSTDALDHSVIVWKGHNYYRQPKADSAWFALAVLVIICGTLLAVTWMIVR